MRVFRVNHAIWGIAPFSAKVQALARVIPGLTWSREAGAYVGMWDAVKLALVSLGEPVENQDEFERVASGSLAPRLNKHLRKGLRAYQTEGVKFLLDRGTEGCILADSMGLGKTCQALAFANYLSRKTLVVTPSYVRGVWQKELAKWWPKAKALFPQGVKNVEFPGPDAKQPDVVVIHYDIIYAWAEILSEWLEGGVIIFDEGHVLQGEKTLRSKAARELARLADYRIVLTGTPMVNRPRDLHNVVDIISPGRFGDFFKYGVRYCDAHKEQVTPEKIVYKFDGRSHEEELRARLSYFMLRRLASDVALELPPKTRQIISVDVPQAGVAATGGMALSSVNMRRYLDRAADAKLPECWEIIKNHIAEGHRVVAFTWRRTVAEWLRDQAALAGSPVELIHGGVSAHRRGLAISAAQAQESGLLVATLDSASVGIDLSYADVCVMVELDYKPHVLLQAEARLHRFGQVNPTLIQYVIAGGTTDEVVASVVIDKLDTFENVVGSTGEKLGADLRGTEEDVLGKLAAAIEGMK